MTSESKFEHIVGYTLISGVAVSLILEVIGMILFYKAYGHLHILESKFIFLHEKSLFYMLRDIILGTYSPEQPILLMGLGIVILMLTPYVRVVLSVFHFVLEKNVKYVLITLFVLILLTLSLAIVSLPRTAKTPL